MNDCVDLDRHLGAYLAGRLAEDAAVALEDHAGNCDRCAALLEARTRPDIPLPTAIAPPEGVRRAVLEQVRRRRAPRLRWLLPPAAAALLVLGWGLTHPTPGPVLAPGAAATPAVMAARSAGTELARIDAARQELEAALRGAPDDAELREALARLEAQRRALVGMVRAYEVES